MPKHFDQAPEFTINQFKADTIGEVTAGAGVTADGVLLKDSEVTTDVIHEKTSATGVTADGVLLKDGGAVFADGAAIEIDTINEATSAAGVTVDGVLLKDSQVTTDVLLEKTGAAGVTIDGLLIKDGQIGALQAITGDGAITIQTGLVFLSKGSAAAITLAAPTSGTHDKIILRIVSISAFAHVITGGVDGFNAKGSSGTITFAANKGSSVTLVAYLGHWYTLSNVGGTVA